MTRINRFLMVLLAIVCLIAVLGQTVWAGEFGEAAGLVDSATLISKARHYNARIVTYRGEVVGDIMARDAGVWLNINDDDYSRQGQEFKLAGYNQGLSVLAPQGTEKQVTRAGNYAWRGDYVEVTGVFHRSSPKHGGEMFIQASSVEVIKPGFRLVTAPTGKRVLAAAVLLSIAAALLWLSQRMLGRNARRPPPS